MRCPACVQLMKDEVTPLPICGFVGHQKPVFRPQNYRCPTLVALQSAMRKLAKRTYGEEYEMARTAWSMTHEGIPVLVTWKRGSDKVENALILNDGEFEPMPLPMALALVRIAGLEIDIEEVRAGLELPEGDEDMDNGA